MIPDVQPVFFATQSGFRTWLAENHDKAAELFVGYYKVGSGKMSMTWSESVDQALCFGWIDGVRQSVDKESYFIRFTPRKPKSIWSAINIKKVEVLTAQGMMNPPGLAAFNLREEHKSKIYTYENEEAVLADIYEKAFKENTRAWSWFQSMAKSYRKTAISWVMSARQETTREKRLNELIRDCEAGRKIKPLSY
ncbi:MAG: YdeI/OmpD-associated family protein [Bacteroidetes bacterium]|nr:YdeI/OmpD-associated family protein [Bacteroidota bacterium]